jgi:hypothetical protein
MRELLIEIDKFRNWASTSDKSYGEWETLYLHWDKIYHFVNKLVKDTPVDKWEPDLITNFLYILARDNEDEEIIHTLIDNPKQLLSLAKHSASFPDEDARWQIAYGLGEIKGNNHQIKNLLNKFLHDDKEYVRRRASFAFSRKGFKN